MLQFSVSIPEWKATSFFLASSADWLQWAQGAPLSQFAAQQPDLSFLPVMQRRRLSPFARMVFVSAWQLIQQRQCPVVFMSRDGEYARSFALLKDLAKGEPLSPTAFGLSVHNALVGQWAMIRHDTSEMTALASREDGIETALLEAYLLLEAGHDEVLVMVAEEPVPDAPLGAENVEPFAYAVSFLVTKGDHVNLCLTEPQSALPSKAASVVDGNLHNLKQLILGTKTWQHALKTQSRCWQWSVRNG